MAVTRHIPVILLLVSLTLVQDGRARYIGQTVPENSGNEEDDSVLDALRESNRELLQRESTRDSVEDFVSEPGLESLEAARRQLMNSTLATDLSRGRINVTEQDGPIDSNMRRGSTMATQLDDGGDWFNVGNRGNVGRNGDNHGVLEKEIGRDSGQGSIFHPPPKKCAHCWIREEVKKLRIETIKTQILKKLRMKAPPNISRDNIPHIPSNHRLFEHFNRKKADHTRRLGAEVGAEELDKYENYYINAQRSVNFGTVPPPSVGNDSQICYFEFKDDVMNSKIEKAKLYVRLRPGRRNGSSPVRLLIYRRILTKPKGGRIVKTLYRFKEIHPPPRGSSWHHFNVTDVVRNWTRRPETNYGLYIEATDVTGKMLPIVIPTSTAESNYKPFVDLKIKDRSSNRQKRMLSRTCEEDALDRNCCRFPLTISFEEFGWDWVIAPKSYNANYCSGECPYLFAQDYQHTHLVQQAIPRNATICCTPRRMHALSMIYFKDSQTVVYGKVPEMVVDTCGCV